MCCKGKQNFGMPNENPGVYKQSYIYFEKNKFCMVLKLIKEIIFWKPSNMFSIFKTMTPKAKLHLNHRLILGILSGLGNTKEMFRFISINWNKLI